MIKNKAYVREVRKFYVGVVQRRLSVITSNVVFLPFSLPSPLLLLKLPIVVMRKFCYHGNETSHFFLLPPTLIFPLFFTFSGEPSSLSLQSNMSLMPFVAMVTGCWI